jgi:hypothetical protein
MGSHSMCFHKRGKFRHRYTRRMPCEPKGGNPEPKEKDLEKIFISRVSVRPTLPAP